MALPSSGVVGVVVCVRRAYRSAVGGGGGLSWKRWGRGGSRRGRAGARGRVGGVGWMGEVGWCGKGARLDDRLVSHLRRRDPTPRILGIDTGGVSGVVTFWLEYELRKNRDLGRPGVALGRPWVAPGSPWGDLGSPRGEP